MKYFIGLLAMIAIASPLAATAYADDSMTYSYDSFGRVYQVTYGNGTVCTYIYDTAGNRTSYTCS